MDEGFQLFAPEGVQLLLKTFGPAERRNGHGLFTSGRVRDLAVLTPGMAFSAAVSDGERVDTRLEYQATRERWEGYCSCGLQRCEHLFAVASAVLAEHRTTEVRRLSSSLISRLQGGSDPDPGVRAGVDPGVETRLKEALGRPLNRTESAFVRNLHNLYEKSRLKREVNGWDFYEFGFQLGTTWGSPVRLWPSFPATEFEFWLYIANGLREENRKIPDFMLPITDLSIIEGQLKKWRRSQEIQQWKSTLGTEHTNLGQRDALPPGEVDLRIEVGSRALRLQWRSPEAPDFTECKDTHFHRLSAGYDNANVLFTTEAELIWNLFQSSVCGPQMNFEHLDAHSKQGLGRLLRMPLLNSRIVSETGQPLERAPEPLRWELTPAESDQDDYRLRLVQADGAPPPRFLARLGHAPTLYLTPGAVFTGPDVPRFMNGQFEASIPAPAMESAAGVSVLHRLHLELPARIRDRVRVLPYQVSITCELVRPEYGPEECRFEIQAEAPDGHQQFWTGFGWEQRGRKRRPANATSAGRNEMITIYDNANLAAFPAVLDPLNIKPNYNRTLSARVTRKFPETFAEWLTTVPSHITVELKGELASFMSDDVAGSVKLDVTEAEIDWFDLQVVLDVADTSLSAAEIKLLLNAKGKYVRLEGKGWRRLKFNLDDEDNERLARLGLSARELSAEPQRLHALQLADPAANKFLPAEQVEQVQRRAGEIKARVAPELPQGVTALLRPYQLEGFHFLAYLATNRFGGILADDMGLGKTLQALAWLLWLRQGPANTPAAPAPPNGSPQQHSPALVVCPKSVMDNWHAEAARFTPGLRVRCWSAGELAQMPAELNTADLHVLNYSQLRTVGDKLLTTRWLALILDEGQYIKNPNSQTAQVARALRAGHRLILSGTPIENRLLDLWSLMSFAMPGVLGNRASFSRLYDAKGDPFARRRLSARVRPFVLRRTKLQVAKDLPDRIEEDLFCEIEGEQHLLYRAELKRAQQLLLGVKTQKELAQQQFHFLTSLLRLRQICCHPKLMNPGSSGASAKTDALIEQLEPLMEEGEKVLVFSQFVQMLVLLRPAIEQRGWPIFYLAGHTENRGELVKNFQSAPGPAVFLISLKAGGFGLNLTAANYVVLFDPWWNPAVENQAIDRTHRIGQTEKVIAYRLLIKNSIEEKIRELQKKKKALAEDVLGEEKFSQSLTLEDFQFLLSG